jgi:hypothetical protein
MTARADRAANGRGTIWLMACPFPDRNSQHLTFYRKLDTCVKGHPRTQAGADLAGSRVRDRAGRLSAEGRLRRDPQHAHGSS